MKKILGLTVAALLVMGLVGGGTWAYFSDTEETTGNIFSAGTIDLGLDNNPNQDPTGSTTATFGATALAPGSAAGSGTLYVNNEGSIDMSHVYISFSLTSYTEATPTSVDDHNLNTGTDNLTNMIIATTVTWNSNPVATLVGKSIEELIALGPTDLGNLNAGVEQALQITWTFSDTATNGCQGDSLDLTISLAGNQ
jgi:spore coat-associated protein N